MMMMEGGGSGLGFGMRGAIATSSSSLVADAAAAVHAHRFRSTSLSSSSSRNLSIGCDCYAASRRRRSFHHRIAIPPRSWFDRSCRSFADWKWKRHPIPLRNQLNSTSCVPARVLSSYEPREKSDSSLVGKNKLLIDCDPEQECVVGGIVALGKFDALHIGHRQLAIQAAKSGVPFLLSFAGIAQVLGWEYRAPIVAKCDRKRVLSSWASYCGGVVPQEYQVDFANVRYLSPREFVERLSMELGVSGVVAGENYRFGYKASGDASDLVKLCEEYGLESHIVSPVMDDPLPCHNGASASAGKREKVSSTRVRHALAAGDMGYVEQLLGRKHRLVLEVDQECRMTGDKLVIPKSCMLNQAPKEGMYEHCSLLIDDKFVGSCRVIQDTENIHIEVDSRDGSPGTCNVAHQIVSIEFG